MTTTAEQDVRWMVLMGYVNLCAVLGKLQGCKFSRFIWGRESGNQISRWGVEDSNLPIGELSSNPPIHS